MSTEAVIEDESAVPSFWINATKYAQAVDRDDPFVEEVAYMMVTLHQTGA